MIIALMVHRRGLSREQLMDMVGTANERAFERDKAALRSVLGVTLEESDRGHYRLSAEGYAMGPLHFSHTEHAAISLALGAWRGTEIEWAARGAMTKLAPLTDDDDPDGIVDPTDGLNTALYAPAAGASEILSAMAERRRIAFDYVTGSTGEVARRLVEPWRLGKRGGSWYLLGFDSDRGAERVFSLRRVLGVVELVGEAEAFTPPAPQLAAARLASALDRDEPGPVLVVANEAAERLLALQGAEPVADADRPIWRLSGASVFDLAAWAGAVEVLEPATVREAVIERWRGAAAAHTGVGAEPSPYRRAVRPVRRAPKEDAAARAARLVSMVSYLADRGSVPLADLARRFQVSVKEAHDDLFRLWTDVGRSAAGGDLLDFSWSDDESWVALVDSQGLDRPVRLSAIEAISLIAALRSIESADGLSEATAAASARAKLEAALGPVSGVDFALPQGGPVLEGLREAIGLGQRLAFRYTNQQGVETRRRADPLEVYSSGDHWLVAAWDLDAQAERHFRLDRIAELDRTGQAESHPYRPRRAGWSARAELVVDAIFAPSERWRAEELETLAPPLPLPGGSLQVKLGVVNPDWITAMALGAGGAIEVLQPAAVRERIVEAAKRQSVTYLRNDLSVNPTPTAVVRAQSASKH
jgi:predicted DNA-binding transcriptional regulator YafY